MKIIRKIAEGYVLSLAFALWGAVCAIGGATYAYAMLVAVLDAKGVL